MKNIYYLFLVMFSAICCVSCNDEWTDEQYTQMASFKANPNDQGVTVVNVRYKSQEKVIYNLPIIMSGSTANSQNRTIHIGLDPDTLAIVNREAYGHREELYFRQLENANFNMPETVDIPAGKSTTTLPIELTLGNVDQSDKWVLPLKILSDPAYNYQVNPHKSYQRAMLQINPFNDYSGSYSGSLYKIFLEPDVTNALTTPTIRTFVVDENTIFLYAGLRDIDYLDRKLYKIYIRFTDDIIDIQKKKLEVYSDNQQMNLQVQTDPIPYYTIVEEMDAVKTYLKHVYITLGFEYTFEDYTSIPGTPIKYKVTGTLTMQRDLNTLIPDEDQQIQW